MNGQQPFDASGAFCQTPQPRSAAMDTNRFWDLIESARSVAGDPDDPADSDQVASEASTLLAARSSEEIIAEMSRRLPRLSAPYAD